MLQGGMGATAFSSDPSSALSMLVPTARVSGMSDAASTYAMSAGALDPRTKAKLQGYEGDACRECGNYTLVRNGTCMKCNTCGGTSGCS